MRILRAQPDASAMRDLCGLHRTTHQLLRSTLYLPAHVTRCPIRRKIYIQDTPFKGGICFLPCRSLPFLVVSPSSLAVPPFCLAPDKTSRFKICKMAPLRLGGLSDRRRLCRTQRPNACQTTPSLLLSCLRSVVGLQVLLQRLKMLPRAEVKINEYES